MARHQVCTLWGGPLQCFLAVSGTNVKHFDHESPLQQTPLSLLHVTGEWCTRWHGRIPLFGCASFAVHSDKQSWVLLPKANSNWGILHVHPQCEREKKLVADPKHMFPLEASPPKKANWRSRGHSPNFVRNLPLTSL